MADVPDTLVLKRDRDLEGRRNDIWIRRGLMALVAAVPVVALFVRINSYDRWSSRSKLTGF